MKRGDNMEKPEETEVELYAVDGDRLCVYVGEHLEVDAFYVFDIIMEQKFGSKDADGDSALFELIIEEEDYCDGEGIYFNVLEFIAEEFGGHFNINFLSICAY
jgi:hypothetical protein